MDLLKITPVSIQIPSKKNVKNTIQFSVGKVEIFVYTEHELEDEINVLPKYWYCLSVDCHLHCVSWLDVFRIVIFRRYHVVVNR